MTAALDHSMTTTAFALEGYRTTKTLGVVRGVTVRSRSILGTIGASLQTLVGGNITLLTELCEKTRADAFELRVGWLAVVGEVESQSLARDVRAALDHVWTQHVDRGARANASAARAAAASA